MVIRYPQIHVPQVCLDSNVLEKEIDKHLAISDAVEVNVYAKSNYKNPQRFIIKLKEPADGAFAD